MKLKTEVVKDIIILHNTPSIVPIGDKFVIKVHYTNMKQRKFCGLFYKKEKITRIGFVTEECKITKYNKETQSIYSNTYYNSYERAETQLEKFLLYFITGYRSGNTLCQWCYKDQIHD